MEGDEVVVFVYDLSGGLARSFSGALLGKQIDGIWHTGVVVYGKEYYFGGLGGIESSAPAATPYGTPVQRLTIGRTQLPREVFQDYLSSIRPQFAPEKYNLFHHNCNNFSDEACKFLTGHGIPSHILELPLEALRSPLGRQLLPLLQQSFPEDFRGANAPLAGASELLAADAPRGPSSAGAALRAFAAAAMKSTGGSPDELAAAADAAADALRAPAGRGDTTAEDVDMALEGACSLLESSTSRQTCAAAAKVLQTALWRARSVPQDVNGILCCVTASAALTSAALDTDEVAYLLREFTQTVEAVPSVLEAARDIDLVHALDTAAVRHADLTAALARLKRVLA